MNIELIQAKNGEYTAKYKSLFLHSAYSPKNEAQRFIENFQVTFNPSIVILCEPALNYIFPFVKEKFSSCRIGIIRYTDMFDKYNYTCDFVINLSDKESLENQLFAILNEEELCSTLFISWQPSVKAFPEQNELVWKNIKNSVEKAKTLLITREYFENKWLLNSCRFCLYIKNISLIKKITLPVAIIASGPSLKHAISYLKNNQNKFFILCLSSAISTLISNNIMPDLCMSTDGGYWAGEHLKKLKKINIPLALACEAYCPEKILKENTIIPLSYSDGISSEILKKSGITSISAIRNGTVSGTALDFALSSSSSDIYFFGLDLASGKAFQHTQPNEIERNNLLKDNRINTLEKRIFSSSLNTESLKIYENWFKSKKIIDRNVFRVIQDSEKQNNFSYIKDIEIDELKNIADKYNSISKNQNLFFSKMSFEKKDFSNYFKSLFQNKAFLQNLFPLDYVAISHKTTDTEVIQKRIDTKKKKLEAKIGKMFYDN